MVNVPPTQTCSHRLPPHPSFTQVAGFEVSALQIAALVVLTDNYQLTDSNRMGNSSSRLKRFLSKALLGVGPNRKKVETRT